MADQDYIGGVATLTIAGDANAIFTGRILELSITDERPKIDITPADQVSGIRQYAAGRLRDMELSGSLQWDPAIDPPMAVDGQVDLVFVDDAATAYRFSTGFLQSFNSTHPHEDRITADFTLAVSGTFTINPI